MEAGDWYIVQQYHPTGGYYYEVTIALLILTIVSLFIYLVKEGWRYLKQGVRIKKMHGKSNQFSLTYNETKKEPFADIGKGFLSLTKEYEKYILSLTRFIHSHTCKVKNVYFN